MRAAEFAAGVLAVGVQGALFCFIADLFDPQVAQPDSSNLVTDGIPPMRRAIRRSELRKIVPLANTTIYEMECRGEFPKRLFLTPRCVVWDLDEVYAWLDIRKKPEEQARLGRAPRPDVHLRKHRPLKSHPGL